MIWTPEPGFGGSPLLSVGQAEAVEQLYRIAAPKLFPRALILSQGNREQAYDLIQLVFQAAIMRWEQISRKEDGAQTAWLFRVLNNKAADAWRVNKREHLLPAAAFNLPESYQDVGDQALCSIALDRALKLMKAMPPVRHRVVCLRILGGWPTCEVAEMLGIAQSTVREHLNDALDDLRREVGSILLCADDDPGTSQWPEEEQWRS